MKILAAATAQIWLPAVNEAGHHVAYNPLTNDTLQNLPEGAYIMADSSDLPLSYDSGAWKIHHGGWCLFQYATPADRVLGIREVNAEGQELAVTTIAEQTFPNQPLRFHRSALTPVTFHSSCPFLPAYFEGYPVVLSKNMPSILINVDDGVVVFADKGQTAWIKQGTRWNCLKGLHSGNIVQELGPEWCPAEDLHPSLFQTYAITA